MIDFGLTLTIKQWGGGWRCYFKNGSAWSLGKDGVWRCLWGGLWEAPSWELERVRNAGEAAAFAESSAMGLRQRSVDRGGAAAGGR